MRKLLSFLAASALVSGLAIGSAGMAAPQINAKQEATLAGTGAPGGSWGGGRRGGGRGPRGGHGHGGHWQHDSGNVDLVGGSTAPGGTWGGGRGHIV